jgi:hypothetical protein
LASTAKGFFRVANFVPGTLSAFIDLKISFFFNIEMTNNENKVLKLKKIGNLKSKLKEKSFEHLSTTHIHGLPHLVRSKHLHMQIFWILFFSLMLSISLWLIVELHKTYFTYPVISVINKHVDEQQEFPAVTICNLNPFISKKSMDYFESNLSTNFTNNDLKESRKQLRHKLFGNYFNLTEKQSFGYSLSDTVISCEFNGKPCTCDWKNKASCSSTTQEFIWHYSFQYGNCYTFNSGHTYDTDTLNENSTKIKQNIKAISKTSIEYGLFLEMYTGVENVKYSLDEYGAIVFIHNQTRSILPESAGNGIILKPGSSTNIAIEKTFNSYTPYPYSECQDLSSFKFDRIYYDAFLDSSLAYARSTCLDLCLRQQIISKCNCSYLEFIQIQNSTPCLSILELKCAESIYFSKDGNNECLDYCPLECDSQQYSFTISSSGYPTANYAHFLQTKNITFEPTLTQLKTGTLRLSIYFDNNKYTLITQSPLLKVYDVFSISGGLLSLFVGFSVLSLVQIFDFFFEIFMIILERKANRIVKTRGSADLNAINRVIFYNFLYFK